MHSLWMQCYVAAEWWSSVGRPSLQHMNTPPGRIRRSLHHFNTIKTRKCVFHYDASRFKSLRVDFDSVLNLTDSSTCVNWEMVVNNVGYNHRGAFWFAWIFLCVKRTWTKGKRPKFTNSSTDSDQSKQTVGVKKPSDCLQVNSGANQPQGHLLIYILAWIQKLNYQDIYLIHIWIIAHVKVISI